MFGLLLPPALSLLAGSAPSPAAPRAGRGARMAGGDVPSIIVGGGRIGSALKELGVKGDVVLRRGDAFPAAPASGPIYVTTRNDDLAGVVAATPPERRQDLVFLQNGMLGEFLEEQGLPDATQVLLYLAVAKLGEPPIDGITDTNPDGLTTAKGRWAEAFRARLAGGGLTCHVKQGDEYTKAMLEKHVWICAFMVTGALHGGVTVGEVSAVRHATASGSSRAARKPRRAYPSLRWRARTPASSERWSTSFARRARRRWACGWSPAPLSGSPHTAGRWRTSRRQSRSLSGATAGSTRSASGHSRRGGPTRCRCTRRRSRSWAW